jgi:hypothetical protein
MDILGTTCFRFARKIMLQYLVVLDSSVILWQSKVDVREFAIIGAPFTAGYMTGPVTWEDDWKDMVIINRQRS